jgi:hypothetical protein
MKDLWYVRFWHNSDLFACAAVRPVSATKGTCRPTDGRADKARCQRIVPALMLLPPSPALQPLALSTGLDPLIRVILSNASR